MRAFLLFACIGVALCNPTPQPLRPSIHADAKGHHQESRIIHGVNANPGQFPYIVSLNFASGGHACGASILTPNWVLTAAHCCVDPKFIYTSSIYLSSGGLRFEEAQVIIHPQYQPDNHWRNDICMIRLSGNIPLGPNAQQVTLAAPGLNVPDNSPVTIIGWGYTTASPPQVIPDRLQAITKYHALSPEHCASLTGLTNIPGNICAIGQDGQATCQGDSGGPLTYNGVQVGLTSFGYMPCGEVGLPDVFTRVSEYIPWIKQNLGQQADLLKIAETF